MGNISTKYYCSRKEGIKVQPGVYGRHTVDLTP
jgi:hypothetical protein